MDDSFAYLKLINQLFSLLKLAQVFGYFVTYIYKIHPFDFSVLSKLKIKYL